MEEQDGKESSKAPGEPVADEKNPHESQSLRTTTIDFATPSSPPARPQVQKTPTRISLHRTHTQKSLSSQHAAPAGLRAQRAAFTGADDLDLEKAPTNTSILSIAGAPAASIHGFDLSRVDTARSTTSKRSYLPEKHPRQLSTIPSSPPSRSSSTSTLPVSIPVSAQSGDEAGTDETLLPPDGGYGWICVIAVFFINAHTWGINSSYGVFLAHYLSHSSFPGATALDYAFVGALSISCGVLISPAAAACSRYFGLTFTLLLGALIEGGSLIAASWATETWELFLSQGAGFGVGFGLLFVGSVGVVSQWFTTKKSLANGLATAGSGVGGLIYSLATSAMLQSLGQSWTFRVLGVLALFVNGICAVVLREWPDGRGRGVLLSRLVRRVNLSTATETKSATPSQTPSPRQQIGATIFAPKALLTSRAYLLLLAYATLSLLGYIALLFSLSSYARSIVHLSASRAALLTALLNLAQGFGRPTIGLLSDKIGRINMAAIGTFAAGALAMIVWTNADGFPGLVVFALVEGAVIGTFWATIAPVTAEIVSGIGRCGGSGSASEVELIAPALNVIWLALVLPCTFSAPIAFQLTVIEGGNYVGCQLFSGAMLVGAAGCLWLIRAWRIGVDDASEEKKGKGLEELVGNMFVVKKV